MTRAETRFRLSAKRTSPFKSAGASVQSTTVSRGVRISGSNAGYTMFRGSEMGTSYPLHSPASPSLPLPCVTVCDHISTGVYYDPWKGQKLLTGRHGVISQKKCSSTGIKISHMSGKRVLSVCPSFPAKPHEYATSWHP